MFLFKYYRAVMRKVFGGVGNSSSQTAEHAGKPVQQVIVGRRLIQELRPILKLPQRVRSLQIRCDFNSPVTVTVTYLVGADVQALCEVMRSYELQRPDIEVDKR